MTGETSSAPPVLVVDDDGDVSAGALSRAGLRTRQCRGGREAFAARHQNPEALLDMALVRDVGSDPLGQCCLSGRPEPVPA